MQETKIEFINKPGAYFGPWHELFSRLKDDVNELEISTDIEAEDDWELDIAFGQAGSEVSLLGHRSAAFPGSSTRRMKAIYQVSLPAGLRLSARLRNGTGTLSVKARP